MGAHTLSTEEIAELAAPFGWEITPSLTSKLSDGVEIAARLFAMMLREDDLGLAVLRDKEFNGELKRIATDPARALDIAPGSAGAQRAREMIVETAAHKNIDLETRAGAVAIGNVAVKYLAMPKTGRSGDDLRLAEEVLFDQLCRTVRTIDPTALNSLPSNEMVGEKAWPIISFAMTFIQLVVDRATQGLTSPSSRVRDRLKAILNKSDRRLLDGIRKDRQYHLRHGIEIVDGEPKAMIFG